MKKSEKTLNEIEQTQQALRESIEQAQKLAARSQELLDKHRDDLKREPDKSRR